jgi:hypothetical protein
MESTDYDFDFDFAWNKICKPKKVWQLVTLMWNEYILNVFICQE